LKIDIFGLKRCNFCTILRRLQTAVEPPLLHEKTFDMISVDEKMLLGGWKSVHRKSLVIEVSWVA
jgi:hypothetical protein